MGSMQATMVLGTSIGCSRMVHMDLPQDIPPTSTRIPGPQEVIRTSQDTRISGGPGHGTDTVVLNTTISYTYYWMVGDGPSDTHICSK